MQALQKKQKTWVLLLLGALLGLAAFLCLYGTAPLDPANDAWIWYGYDETDIHQHYAGWLGFRNSSWQFPLAQADALALSLGVETEDPQRLEAGLLFELTHNLNNGHTFLPYGKLVGATAQLLECREEQLEERLEAEALDITVPGKAHKLGHKHPMYTALDEIKEIFIGMGFTVLDGPEVELAELNFDRLNAEEGHPSRDWSDTFYFDEDSRVMLRSQTSPMQVRTMEKGKLPIRMVCPGAVYRSDEVDATHSPVFHQLEGMVIDKNITMADLKGTLNAVMEQLYGAGTKTRFRPHHFPFTEPSCEMDVQCHKCGGVGCPTCKGEGWIEVLGAGMIHPKVLELSGIDPEVYSGWAFGMGLERMAMRRFKIADLRLIFENDVRFLEQF